MTRRNAAPVLLLPLLLARAPASPPGVVETLAGPIEAGTGGLEVDADGNVYTSDFGATLSEGPLGTRVYRITPEGQVSEFADGLRGASGNAFDAQGRLLQSNIGGGGISRIEADGTVETLVEGRIRTPVGILPDPDGIALVTSCAGNEIVRVTADRRVETVVADSLLRCPNGLTRTPNGDLFVSNFANGDVVRITAAGEASRFATVPGGNNGHILYGNGVLYVAARGANRIYALTLGGALRVLAGTGERGHRDGPAARSTLSLPNDVALSPDGRVLYWNEVGPLGPETQTLTPTFVRRLTLPNGTGPGTGR